jgi:hypothetical protein
LDWIPELTIETGDVVVTLTAGVVGLFDDQQPVYEPPVEIVTGPS